MVWWTVVGRVRPAVVVCVEIGAAGAGWSTQGVAGAQAGRRGRDRSGLPGQ